MNAELLRLINCWLGNAPESYHYYDNERLFDAVKFAYRNNLLDSLYSINWVDLMKIHYPQWSNDDVQEFVEEWSLLIEWFVLLLDSMQEDGTIPNYRQG